MVKQICGQFALLILAAGLFAAEPVTAPPELKDARVSLPYAELKSLWQAAQHERAPEKRKPPAESTLLAARYQLVLKGDQASVETFVTQKALDGLFVMMADEEKAIRADPIGKGTDIVKKVFGALGK